MRDKDLLDKETRENLLDAVEKVVDYAHTHKIDTVLLAGRKAGPFLELFNIIWGRKYKTRPPFFVSPGHIGALDPERRVALIKEKLSQKPILGNLKGNVLLFDDLMYSAGTLLCYDRALKELGIPHRIVSVLADSLWNSKPDAAKLSSRPFIGRELKNEKLYVQVDFLGRSMHNLRRVRRNQEPFYESAKKDALLNHKYQLAMLKRLKKLAHKKPR